MPTWRSPGAPLGAQTPSPAGRPSAGLAGRDRRARGHAPRDSLHLSMASLTARPRRQGWPGPRSARVSLSLHKPVFSGKLGAAAVISTTSGRRDVHPGRASGTRPAGSPEAPHLVPQTAWPATPRPELQGAGTRGRLGAITGQLVMSHVPPQRTPAPPRAAVCRAVT